MLNLLRFIFLGIIQGITEPIPVSSSGHLLVFQKLVGGIENIDFGILATITNLGSFLAICLIFKNRIIELIKSFFGYLKNKDKKDYNNYCFSRFCFTYIFDDTFKFCVIE